MRVPSSGQPTRISLPGHSVILTRPDGWIGFNLLPDQAGEKIKRIEELLKLNSRSRCDVKLAPYTNPIKTDDLKRYRDAGVEELALMAPNRPRTERDVVAGLEQLAKEFVEPAAKL